MRSVRSWSRLASIQFIIQSSSFAFCSSVQCSFKIFCCRSLLYWISVFVYLCKMGIGNLRSNPLLSGPPLQALFWPLRHSQEDWTLLGGRQMTADGWKAAVGTRSSMKFWLLCLPCVLWCRGWCQIGALWWSLTYSITVLDSGGGGGGR